MRLKIYWTEEHR